LTGIIRGQAALAKWKSLSFAFVILALSFVVVGILERAVDLGERSFKKRKVVL
jgi:hypothetical protein